MRLLSFVFTFLIAATTLLESLLLSEPLDPLSPVLFSLKIKSSSLFKVIRDTKGPLQPSHLTVFPLQQDFFLGVL